VSCVEIIIQTFAKVTAERTEVIAACRRVCDLRQTWRLPTDSHQV